ncbi:MAG: glycoside hydrolase family 31 protein [Rhizomicrobium sp.]
MSTLLSPPVFRLAARDGNHLTLQSDGTAVAHVFVLEDDIIRVLVLPDGRLRQPKSWTIAPGQEDVAAEGRDRFDLTGFALPPFALRESEDMLVVQTACLRLTIRLAGFFCAWDVCEDPARGFLDILRDRPTQAYNFGWWDDRVHHYLVRDPAERYFGLGERSGEMDRAGRRFRLCNVDAMGYDARTSDPLYKHIPFYITRRDKAAAGLFYDTLSDCTFDMGCERSNYHGLFRGFVADHGDLDYYVIGGTIGGIVRRYTWLTGRPALPPRWALGYSGSTMSYTDQPDAQARMAEFLAKCEEHDILCDSFHLSSGYTSIGAKRYVFHWNRDKFPDPAAFVRSYAEKGVRLIPNIKPALLHDHPLFAEARDNGLLITDANGEPEWVQFWGAVGAYLDFTNPATADWWAGKVTSALLHVGMAGTWNDNNEFEIVSPKALARNFGAPAPAVESKPLQTMLMLRASRAAQVAQAPQTRPFLVSRAGAAGMQRYVQTWSGDNYTSWETLQYNIRMGLGLALSGVSNTGHDVGGFDGPRPDAELFVRWVAFGIFMPRFSIHSWNTDRTANEPWMHPEVTAHVRDLIKFRYRLLPYLYDLLWRYARDYEPAIRPTFLDFPDDPRTYDDNDEMLLGRALLVAPVVEPGVASREVYLPAGTRWFDYWSGEIFDGGRVVARPAPFRRPPLFAREGSVIALNVAEQHFQARGDTRAFQIFPLARGAFEAEIFDDDGESEAWREGRCRLWRVRVVCDAATIVIAVSATENDAAVDCDVPIVLPATEKRDVTVSGGHPA